ncbi:MAG: metalloregulator ArsR/SmtB family transcription factor [Candidatus Eisenbacteria bacterium]|nr:metalloregulator ArsR/SmtB family transcription factor [Candidatus Eisenbacteria bacterium]
MMELYQQAASLFQALADPTRLELLQRIAPGECCASDLHTALGMSQPRIARHLKILVDAGLITARRDGRFVRYVVTRERAAGGVLLAALGILASNSGRGGEAPASRVSVQRTNRPAGTTPPPILSNEPIGVTEDPPRGVLEDFLL